MPQIDTNVLCPLCKIAMIVAEVGSEPTVSETEIPVGPAARDYYKTTMFGFHCSNIDCQVMFHHPPGRPNAASEILSSLPEPRWGEE